MKSISNTAAGLLCTMAIDGHGGVHVVWADWTPGERAIYLGSINIESFKK